jgi:LysR family transcriptional regulator (chromosome initiation inhibitor)
VELAADDPIDVSLFWHSWKVQSPRLERLSQTVIAAARRVLR